MDSKHLTELRAQNAELVAALKELTAGFAVTANHAGTSHPGLADADNLASIRRFAHENFCIGRAALARAEKGE